jgi:hypothetical protein
MVQEQHTHDFQHTSYGWVVYLSPADKCHRLTHRPSQGQIGFLDRWN